MRTYLVRRLLQLPFVLIVVSVVLFSLMHVTGDPVSIWLGDEATAEIIVAQTKYYGLDKPLAVQYGLWLWNIARGDFGRSIRTGEKVSDMIVDRLPLTLILAILAMLLALAVAIPVGIISAYKNNSYIDYLSMLGAMLGMSMPDFALAVLLILIFAVRLRVLPTGGAGDLLSDPVGAVRYYVMPVLALSASRAAVLARLLRSSMLDVLRNDYITVARGKGLANTTILWKHALKNATIPLVTAAAMNFAFLFGGAISIEWIFALPGVGSLLMRAVLHRDFPVIQGVTLWLALIFIIANLCADLLYTRLDPRIRYE